MHGKLQVRARKRRTGTSARPRKPQVVARKGERERRVGREHVSRWRIREAVDLHLVLGIMTATTTAAATATTNDIDSDNNCNNNDNISCGRAGNESKLTAWEQHSWMRVVRAS